ncbi:MULTISPECIES: hypothetical protein [Fischerella]|uniref:hypothetical protein n=1 Tax=Fischerella TaxID=1190 RepID=UPI0002D2F51F|nr:MULTISPECIES: hypothetical protein [Fischerella]MBD2431650.1 hypothetical protein [Fischerella sp. FACHB-380]
MIGRYLSWGIGLPSVLAVSNQAAFATITSRNASSGVSPQAEQNLCLQNEG